MSAPTTLNHNVAECLHKINHIGGSTVRNICSGADAYVPWGAMDWVLAGGALAGGAIMIGALLVMVVSLARLS